jgi:hypothetical protein
MTMDIEQQFVELCRQAYKLDLATDDERDVELIMVEILRLVKSHPEHRDVFVKLFSQVAENTILAPEYLLPFCMRDLQFLEIREKLWQEWNGDRNTARFARRMTFISDVLHAFDDTIWEDADIWSYYAHEQDQDPKIRKPNNNDQE